MDNPGGATQNRFCAMCGAPLIANAGFCGSCGQRVEPVTAQAVPPLQRCPLLKPLPLSLPMWPDSTLQV